MKRISIILMCVALFTTSCGPSTKPDFIIVPDQCKINVGEQIPLSLRGTNIPSSGVITWSATRGEIDPPTGYNVIYTAPQEPGNISINAVLEADGVQSSAGGLTCEVVALTTPLPPTPTSAPTFEPPTREPPTQEPTASIPPTSSGIVGDTVAITEVMAYPCGASDGRPSINEYIELYNFGAADVNVRDWWIGTTGGGEGTPDQLAPWNAVNPTISLGSSVKVNETVIPPDGFAVVLSPKYHTGVGKYRMPYAFPKDTIILTFSNSVYVGNDSKGLVASSHPLTTIVLYQGSDSIIDTVVSTYGTPSYGFSPTNIVDDKKDNFPYFISECHAMERIDASKPDALTNWREINSGNPGSGNYGP